MNRVPAAYRMPAFLRPAPDSLFMQEARRDRDPRYQMLHALWSFWVFMTPLFTPVGVGYWWSLAISYPLFLMLFVLVHLRPTAEQKLYVVALTVLAAVSMKWNPSAWTYGVFACVYVPYRGSVLASLASMTLVQLPLVIEAVLFGWPFWVILLMLAVNYSSGAGALFGCIAQLRDAELRLSQDEVRRLAATAERERIGRDLHDLLGHTLSLITLKLELSRKLFDKDRDASRRELEDAERVARHALAEVRAAVTGIRAAGLAAELASAKLLLESSGVSFEYEQAVANLPRDIECGLALVLREAVTNIHRHARAHRAGVVLRREGEDVHMEIRDDGRGGIDGDGNGLSGMRERVNTMNGVLRIDSPPRRGTRIEIVVPMPTPFAAAKRNDDDATAAARLDRPLESRA